MGINPDALYALVAEDLGSSVCSRTLADFEIGGSRERSIRDLSPTPSVEEVASFKLLESLFKKFRVATPDSAKEKAIQAFLDSNERCKTMNESGVLPSDLTVDHVIDYAVGDFVNSFRALSELPISLTGFAISNIGVGPGASVASTGTSFYEKLFCSTMTTTNETLPKLYDLFVKSRPSEVGIWRDAEDKRSASMPPYEVVQGSNLSVVDKNVKIGRVICTEPSLNMMFQKGVSSVFERILAGSFGINLETQQSFNRHLARVGSITGRFSTLDLKEASNSISLGLVHKFCVGVPEVEYLLNLTRSPVTVIDGKPVTLHMLSSMGNGYTFSFMTLILTCLVKSTYSLLGIPFRVNRGTSCGNFAVFGDDIIIEKKALPVFKRVLSSCGFIVNDEKSFSEGYFRESCGGDFYKGHRVTGVYVKSLVTPQDCVSVLNRLVYWESMTGIPLNRSITWLKNQLFRKFGTIPLVPPYDGATAGIRVPFSVARNHASVKSLMPAENGGNIVYRYTRFAAESGGYQFSEELDSVSVLRPRLFKTNRKFIVDPNAIIIATMHGSVRQRWLSVRLNCIRYQRRSAVVPVWDYFPDDDWPMSNLARMLPGGMVCNIPFAAFTLWERVCRKYFA